jgi:hypothetical protein
MRLMGRGILRFEDCSMVRTPYDTRLARIRPEIERRRTVHQVLAGSRPRRKTPLSFQSTSPSPSLLLATGLNRRNAIKTAKRRVLGRCWAEFIPTHKLRLGPTEMPSSRKSTRNSPRTARWGQFVSKQA